MTRMRRRRKQRRDRRQITTAAAIDAQTASRHYLYLDENAKQNNQGVARGPKKPLRPDSKKRSTTGLIRGLLSHECEVGNWQCREQTKGSKACNLRYGFLLSFPNLKFRNASVRARDHTNTETAGGVRAKRHDAGSRLASDIKTPGGSRGVPLHIVSKKGPQGLPHVVPRVM